MLVVGRDHPRIRKRYLWPRWSVSFIGLHRRQCTGIGLCHQRGAGLERLEDYFVVSEFIDMPLIVAATDFVSVMPQSMAGTLEKTGLVAHHSSAPATLGNQDDLACRALARSWSHVAASDRPSRSSAICR